MEKSNAMKNVSVDEYTTPSPIVVKPQQSLKEIQEIFRSENIRHMPIVDEGRVVGILTDRDIKLLSSLFEDLSSITAQSVMTKDPYTVEPDASLESVVFHMSKEKIGSAIVQSSTDDYLGIFTSTDALNALLEVLRGEA